MSSLHWFVVADCFLSVRLSVCPSVRPSFCPCVCLSEQKPEKTAEHNLLQICVMVNLRRDYILLTFDSESYFCISCNKELCTPQNLLVTF